MRLCWTMYIRAKNSELSKSKRRAICSNMREKVGEKGDLVMTTAKYRNTSQANELRYRISAMLLTCGKSFTRLFKKYVNYIKLRIPIH